jgi:diguanylate cyclase (GGDEF)-like protein/PAS domain S-box-containing protein
MHNKKDRKPFDAQDVFMLQGLAAGAAVALENATILKQRDNAKKELAWQKSYYETLLDEANVWIEAVDMHGRTVLWNRKAEEISGYQKKDVIGTLDKWAFLYPDTDERTRLMRLSKQLATTGKTVKDMETEITVASGKKRVMSWSSNIIKDSAGETMGSMFIGADITDRKLVEKEREVLTREILWSNKRLKQLALKDAQTGLYNHHYLGEVIESEYYRAKRYGHPLSIVMVDIDYFKSVNDLYGHEFGDLVLKQFAIYLRKLVRKYDVVVRYGGEEFVILSSGADRAKALAMAQRLLEAINIYSFGDDKHVIKLKLSMAVASHPEDRISKGMDLVDEADRILMRVKEAGGNNVYTSEDVKKGKRPSFEKADVTFLKEKIAKLTRRDKQSLMESIFAFAKTIEMRDHYTGKHAESTVRYSTEIAKALKLSREEIERLKQAAVLHDLGKIGISDKILHKKSRLSAKEYEEIKRHPQIAADIIRPIQFMHDIIPLILYHHERWDGKGYPAGLKGEEIPIMARIISVADAFDAITTNRPYRKKRNTAEAVKEIMKFSGTQFDPVITDAFLRAFEKGKIG